MIEEKNIVDKNKYGMIYCNLKELMNNKNITISEMSHLAKIKYDTVIKYYYNEMYFLNLEILAKFCYVLKCDISDLISYKK